MLSKELNFQLLIVVLFGEKSIRRSKNAEYENNDRCHNRE
jgi:hypothetical protein